MLQEARERAVGEHPAAGLAARTVVRFVGGVADALDRRAAVRAGLGVAPVHRHAVAKGGDLLGKVLARRGAQAPGPVRQGFAGGREEALDLGGLQLSGHGDRREPRALQDLVGIGIADAAEQLGVAQGALQGVVFRGQAPSEGVGLAGHDLEAARVEGAERRRALDDVQAGPALGAGLAQGQAAVREVEGGQIPAPRQVGARRLPVQAAGDHQVENQPQLVLQADGDALADAPQGDHALGLARLGGRLGGAQQKGMGDAQTLQRLVQDAPLEGFDVNRDVWQLGHG